MEIVTEPALDITQRKEFITDFRKVCHNRFWSLRTASYGAQQLFGRGFNLAKSQVEGFTGLSSKFASIHADAEKILKEHDKAENETLVRELDERISPLIADLIE